MHSYKAFGLNIFSEIELPELSKAGPTDNCDLVIKYGSVDLSKLSKTPIYRRGTRALFGKGKEGGLILHWPEIASFEAIDGKTLMVSPLTDDPNLLSLFTVSEALGLILFQKGYFLLHASAVKVGDEAWCFMGNPGVGKSTTAAAFIKAGCQLLSDDLTAIGFDQNGVAQIIPSYPQLKIWDNTVNGLSYDRDTLQPVSEGINKFSYQPKKSFDHKPVKLGAIYFLHKAKNRAASKALSPGEIPIETLRNFPLPVQLLKGEALKKHFAQSFKCAVTARLWRKRRPDGFAKLENWISETLSSISEI
ncbi:serine kinase [Dyadobacter psychrotolerans]|uniref:Serine kinase n=1 Tax=Dyadobacter psychrotolerans TaxID=2541721 RepID=A0A4R5DV88_9BACT|nr:serine kinase [Dyadobacter psychrotolerans]TDE16270.1 serine kinase [Dyadobacter psychrotolerans]